MKKDYGCVLRFLLLFFAFFFQTSPLIQKISITSVTPNLVFILLFIYSIYLKDSEVVTYSLIFGSLADLLFMKIYGIHTLLLLGFVFLWQFLKRYIYTENKLIVALFMMGYSLFFEFILKFIEVSMQGEIKTLFLYAKAIFVKSLYNGLLAFFAFIVAKRIHLKKQEVSL